MRREGEERGRILGNAAGGASGETSRGRIVGSDGGGQWWREI